jgi:hypothetical protein
MIARAKSGTQQCGGRREKSQPKDRKGNRVYTDWQSGTKVEIPG